MKGIAGGKLEAAGRTDGKRPGVAPQRRCVQGGQPAQPLVGSQLPVQLDDVVLAPAELHLAGEPGIEGAESLLRLRQEPVDGAFQRGARPVAIMRLHQ